jgi:hypothetical protein
MIITMHKIKTTLFGYVRPLARFAASGQETTLIAYGVEPRRVCVEGRGEGTLASCIQILRPGNVLAVRHMHLLAPAKSSNNDKPRRALWAALKAVEDKKASVYEVSTARSSLNKDERDAMLADAIEALTHAGRSPRKGHLPGRPAFTYSEKQIDQARRAWFDLRHRTNSDAIRASPVGWTAQRSYDEFGPSGRGKR